MGETVAAEDVERDVEAERPAKLRLVAQHLVRAVSVRVGVLLETSAEALQCSYKLPNLSCKLVLKQV